MSVRMILPLLFGFLGVAILLWLGFWQIDRLAWKEGRLAVISTKMAAEEAQRAQYEDQAAMVGNIKAAAEAAQQDARGAGSTAQ